MSKFFAQLLLSIMISVGAAVGFRSDARGELNKTWREAKVSLQETAKIAIHPAAHVKTQVNTAASVSAKANPNVKASIKDNAKADARTKGNLDVQVVTGGGFLDNSVPAISLDGSLNTNSQTTVGANAPGLELDLKNRVKSTLDVGLDILR